MTRADADAMRDRLEQANPGIRYEVLEGDDELAAHRFGGFYVRRAGKVKT